MGHLRTFRQFLLSLLLSGLLLLCLYWALTWPVYAQRDPIVITGIDPHDYPIITITVDFPEMIAQDGLNAPKRDCSFDILENLGLEPYTTTIEPNVVLGSTKLRLAFLLDLTSYEIQQGAQSEFSAALRRLGNFCAWQPDDKMAVFVPNSENGERATRLVDWTTNHTAVVTRTGENWPAFDGNIRLTDLDSLLEDVLSDPEFVSAEPDRRHILVLVSNGLDRGNNLNVEAIRKKLLDQKITLYVIFWADRKDSAESLLNLSALIDSDPSHYYDLRNIRAINNLWQKVVNSDLRFVFSYTTKLQPPYELSVQAQSVEGKVTAAAKTVSPNLQPYAVMFQHPYPGATLMASAVTPTLTATLMINNPQLRQNYPYTLEYWVDNLETKIVNENVYTAPFEALPLPISISKLITIPDSLSGMHTLNVRIHEQVTGLTTEASTLFTVREPVRAIPPLYSPKSLTFRELWLLVSSLWPRFRYNLETSANWRFGIQLIPLLLLGLIAFLVWVRRFPYNYLDGRIQKAQGEVDDIKSRLRVQQSETVHETMPWPSLPGIKAELILLQGIGMLYDYIALTKESTTFGSNPSANIAKEHWTLRNQYIDGIHCIIKEERGAFWIYDGDDKYSNNLSRNHIYVNGKKVGPEGYKLSSGDVISLSEAVKYSFRMRQVQPDVAVAPTVATSEGGPISSGYEPKNRLL